MNIHIHTTVSENSLRYFDYVCANYVGLSSGNHGLRFYAYCLDEESYALLKDDSRMHQVVSMPFGRGSQGHAKSIEAAIANFAPGEVNIISDTDIALFMQGWDEKLVEALCTQTGLGVVATRLEGIGGFSTGDTPYQQYKNKPSTTWMAMSPHYDFSKLKVFPDKDNFIEITTPELADLYQLPLGFFVVKDTGWQVPSYLQDNSIPYLALDIVKPTSDAAVVLKGCSPYHDEFHWAGAPFLAHQRGSMKHRFRIDPLSVDFYDACDRYFGAPAWAVFPTAADRSKAKRQDAIERLKAPLRKIKRALLG